MSEDTTLVAEISPLRFLLRPPTSIDDALARGTAATGRLISQVWDQQRTFENCIVRVQACLFGTAEQMWRQSLAACYLREPRRSERISVA